MSSALVVFPATEVQSNSKKRKIVDASVPEPDVTAGNLLGLSRVLQQPTTAEERETAIYYLQDKDEDY